MLAALSGADLLLAFDHQSRTSAGPRSRISALRSANPPSFFRVAVILAVIGVALAGPSFLIAANEVNPAALVVGVATIYLALLALSQTQKGKNLLCNRALVLSIVSALALRVFTVPCNWIVDVIAGVFSTRIVGIGTGELGEISNTSFIRALFATFVQGILGLTAFSILTAMMYSFHRKRLIAKDESGRCIRCGYDLRASADRCPECGSPVPVGHQPAEIPPAAND